MPPLIIISNGVCLMSLFGGLLSLAGGLLGNKANKDEAASNRAFQAQQSATAHQREVEDLRAAGINPILSAGGQGASTPSGSMATYNDVVTPALSSAMQMKRVDAEIENMKETNKNLRSQNDQIATATELNKALRVKALSDAAFSANSAKSVELNNVQAANEADFAGTTFGKALTAVNRISDALQGGLSVVNSATSLTRSSPSPDYAPHRPNPDISRKFKK